ncbi:MAG: hypothetical protein AAGL11_11305 [Pseudomonadota bacterium]
MASIVERLRSPTHQVFWLIFIYALYLHRVLGMDGFFDTENYHYYLGWMGANFRAYEDGALAQYHTFLNPIADIINYTLFELHPYIGALYHAAILAGCGALVFRILLLVSPDPRSTFYDAIALPGAVIMGLSATMTVTQFGSWGNEHITALFLLASIYCVLLFYTKDQAKHLILAGVFCGIAAALKLTSLPSVLVICLTIALIGRKRFKLVFMAGAATLGAFLVLDAPYMIARAVQTGNPIFPVANGVFASELIIEEQPSFNPLQLEQIWIYLTLPWQWLTTATFSENADTRDGRMLLAFIGIGCTAFAMARGRKQGKHDPFLLLIFMFLATWVCWLLIARIWRYLIVWEMLTGVLFFVGLWRALGDGKTLAKGAAIASAMALLFTTTTYPDWGRRAWTSDFVHSNIPDLKLAETGVTHAYLMERQLSILSEYIAHDGIRLLAAQAHPDFVGDRQFSPLDPVHFGDPIDGDPVFITRAQTDVRELIPSLTERYPYEVYEFVCAESTDTLWLNPFVCRFRPAS